MNKCFLINPEKNWHKSTLSFSKKKAQKLENTVYIIMINDFCTVQETCNSSFIQIFLYFFSKWLERAISWPRRWRRPGHWTLSHSTFCLWYSIRCQRFGFTCQRCKYFMWCLLEVKFFPVQWPDNFIRFKIALLHKLIKIALLHTICTNSFILFILFCILLQLHLPYQN